MNNDPDQPIVDTTFDMRSDAGGKDPDAHSATLRRYHQILWSRPLPSGAVLALGTTTPGFQLLYDSPQGAVELSSDSIIHTYSYWTRTEDVIRRIPQPDIADFVRVAHTIGGYIVFPGNRIDGRPTINMARGTSREIHDRFDLTLECIRLHYLGRTSPLTEVISRYSHFFHLFGDFDGYVDFFLLQDLVDADGRLEFFMPFDDFPAPTFPRSVAEYETYRERASLFVTKRNRRIQALFGPASSS